LYAEGFEAPVIPDPEASSGMLEKSTAAPGFTEQEKRNAQTSRPKGNAAKSVAR
jgi:hypothetical protein